MNVESYCCAFIYSKMELKNPTLFHKLIELKVRKYYTGASIWLGFLVRNKNLLLNLGM